MRPAISRTARPAISRTARAVHDAALIVDLHADTPKLMARGYDLFRRHENRPLLGRLAGHVDVPRMREGGLKAQFFTCWTFPHPERGCAEDVHRQLDALCAAAAAHPDELRLCTGAAAVREAAGAAVRLGLCGIEGGQALEGRLDNLEAFARRGVRYLGLLHFSANAIGRPARGFRARADRGLTPFGVEVVDACARLGVLVDLAHINRRGFLEAVARRPGPLLVSHTGLCGVTPLWRNIDDEQLRAVADSGGCVGVVFAPRYVGGDLEAVCDHLLHVIDVAGEDVAALGSDWDGMIRPAPGLCDPAGLPWLTEALLRRGLRDTTIHKLLGGNVLRVLDAVPARVADAVGPRAAPHDRV